MSNIVYQPYDLRDYIAANIPDEIKAHKDLSQWEMTLEQRNTVFEMTRSIISGGKNYLGNKIPFAASFGVAVNTWITLDLEAPAAVNLSMTKSSLTPRMNLYINPFWLVYTAGEFGNKFIDDESFFDVACILLHEYMHLLYNHHEVFKYYSQRGLHKLVNLATDTQINQDEMIAKNGPLTRYGITLAKTEQLVGKKLEAKQASTYYFEQLMAKRKELQEQMNTCAQCGQPMSGQGQGQSQQDQGQGSGSGEDENQDGQGDQNGQNQGGSGQDQDQQQQGQDSGSGQGDEGGEDQDGQSDGRNSSSNQDGQSQQGQPNKKSGHTCQNCGHHNADPLGQAASHAVWAKTPKDCEENAGAEIPSGDDVERTIASAVEDAMERSGDLIESLKQRGLVGGNILDRIMNGGGEPGKLPIKSVLLKGTGKLKLEQRKTFRKPNPHQGTRPDIRRGKVFDNAKNVWVFLDNSGSMGADEISWAMNEIAAVAKRVRAKVDVYPFDTVVHSNNKQFADRTGKWTFQPVGRGGTAFQPVFDWLRDHTKANNQNDLIIVITDGYGERQVDTHGLRNVIWLLVEEKRNTLSVEDPVGQVAWLDQDDKYKLHKMS